MKKLLITGGAGFIGSNIAHEALRRGHAVRILDDMSTGRRENLSEIERDVELIEADIRDRSAVEKAANGVDYILHQAALPSVARSIKDPQSTHEVNATGTLNVLLASRKASVGAVVMASSSSVYGNTPVLPKHEEMPTSPLSPYAVSKLAGEQYGRVFHDLYSLPVVVLRYFNVFGPRQNPDSQYSAVIPLFCKALLAGTSPVIYGDGEQSRDFTHIDNVVEANLLACTSTPAFGRVLNIAAGGSYSVNDLFRRLKRIIGGNVEPTYLPPREGEVRDSFADVSLAKQLLGFRVVRDFNSGLQQTVEHFRGA